MKKLITVLIIFLMLCSMFIIPNFVDNVESIGLHEVNDGTTNGTIPIRQHGEFVALDSAEAVWKNGSYVYAVYGASGITAYTFDGNTFTFKDKVFGVGLDYFVGVWANSTYIFVVTNIGARLLGYTFNETGTEDFWLKGEINTGSRGYAVWSDGTYVYVANSMEGVEAFTFDGSTFTSIDEQHNGTSSFRDVWGDGTYIYVACGNDGVRAYTFDGVSFTLKGEQDDGGSYRDIWGDGTYIYAATRDNGLHAYSFDGTSFTLLDTATDATDSRYESGYADATDPYIYVSCYSDGVKIYSFNGTDFLLEQSMSMSGYTPQCHVFDDYLYVSRYTDGISAYNRFDKFTLTRNIGLNTESNNFTFTPSYDQYNVNIQVSVSTDVKGIIDVTNNTDSILAIEVNNSGELINNTFWYDSANQFVYIRTINLTASTVVNWTVNCSYGIVFNLIIPPYLEVGQYFHSSGFIENSTGYAVSGMVAETRLLYPNGTDALSVNPKHNCTSGNYLCTFSTSTLLPGVYSVSIEFSDPGSGIIFKEGATLYLSVDPGEGIYVSTFLHFTFYDSNTRTGIPSESFQIYASIDSTIDATDRIYTDLFGVYTGQTIYYRVDDYFDNQIFPTSGDYQTLNITTMEQFENIPIEWVDIALKNLNFSIIRFSMENGSRYYNVTLFPMDSFHFLIIPGEYNITKRYYNPFNGSYIKTETDSIVVSSNDFYIASGFTSIVHISWYNTNEALGLPDETLKLYIDGTRQIEMEYYTHINNTINITVKDYYNTTLYQNNITIDAQYEFIDLGLTFHSWLFGNKNDINYMLSVLKQGGSRWWERGIVPYGEREFTIPSGNYTLRIYYNDSGNYTEIYNNSNHTIAASSVYVIHGTNLSEIIRGQSVIIGKILELGQEEYDYPWGAEGDYNQPNIPSPKIPKYPDEPLTVSETYDLLRITQMPKSNAEVTIVFIDSGCSSRTYNNIDLSNIIAYSHPIYNTPYDTLGHGTWISYALASIFQTHLPNARLISFKVFNKYGECTLDQLIEAFDAVKKLKPDIISFSGGMWGNPLDQISKKIEELRGEGITVVVAAGNLGPINSTILSPGGSKAAICIGAIDPMSTILDRSDDTVTSWSSRGPVPFVDHKPDFMAPGESILGPWLNTEAVVSGTSMATPLVAAGMAIMYGNNKDILDLVDALYFWDGQIIPNILEDAMKDTAFKKSPIDSYGWGIPDFEKANNAIFLRALGNIILFISLVVIMIIASALILRYLRERKRVTI